MPINDRPLRRDAERNRALVLATAQTLISKRGLDIPYEDIARAAGVGMGTVYRRFPAHQDLLDALFVEHIDAVVAVAQQAQECDDAWEGLGRFMRRNLEMQARDRGLSELLRGASHNSQLVADAHRRIGPIIDDLVARAHSARQLAPEITAGDFVLVQLMVGGVIDASRDFAPDLWRRSLAIGLAGLADADQLPGSGPDARGIERLHRGYDRVTTRRRG